MEIHLELLRGAAGDQVAHRSSNKKVSGDGDDEDQHHDEHDHKYHGAVVLLHRARATPR